MVDIAPDAALLVVDVQRGFDDPSWGARNNPDAEAKIGQLLEEWRAAKRPIVHVFHDSTSPESPLRPDTAAMRPKPKERLSPARASTGRR